MLALLLAAAPLAAGAQQALEIISLRYRTVEQVLPALQPLVEPGGTLSGSRGQLFLRASPANLAEIRRALDAIDRPSRRLTISVRHNDAGTSARRELGARGVVSSSGSRVTITAEDQRRDSGERIDQRVQVVEGGRAYIAAGQSRPLGSAGIQDMATGFEVTPRLSGDWVMLEIATRKESPGPRPGSVQGQRAVSTVGARLGEWVEIGGTSSQLANEGRASVRADESRRVWLKVEEAK
ncbi:MAG TPA: secretin N-terminal domain-containing protein [Burkholderiales bacterium]